MTITFEQFHTCDACGCDLENKDECICQVCKDKNLVAKVKAAILAKYAFPDVDPKLCLDAIPYASYYF